VQCVVKYDWNLPENASLLNYTDVSARDNKNWNSERMILIQRCIKCCWRGRF